MRLRPAGTGCAMTGTPPAATRGARRCAGRARSAARSTPRADAGCRERLAAVARESARDQRIRDVRAAHRRPVRGLRHDVRPHEVVVAADVRDDPLGAADPVEADARGLRAESLVLRVEEVGEQVHAAVVVRRAQLHAGKQRHPERCGCFPPPRPAVGRVVVGQRDRAETMGVRGADDIRGALGAVGADRVQVQVARSFEPPRLVHLFEGSAGCRRRISQPRPVKSPACCGCSGSSSPSRPRSPRRSSPGPASSASSATFRSRRSLLRTLVVAGFGALLVVCLALALARSVRPLALSARGRLRPGSRHRRDSRSGSAARLR